MHINTNRQSVIDVRMVLISASSYLCVCVCTVYRQLQIHIHHTSEQEVKITKIFFIKRLIYEREVSVCEKVSPSVCVGERGCGS